MERTKDNHYGLFDVLQVDGVLTTTIPYNLDPKQRQQRVEHYRRQIQHRSKSKQK